MIAALRLVFSILPAPVQLLIFGIVGLLVLIVVFRIIAMVLNAIPFF